MISLTCRRGNHSTFNIQEYRFKVPPVSEVSLKNNFLTKQKPVISHFVIPVTLCDAFCLMLQYFVISFCHIF